MINDTRLRRLCESDADMYRAFHVLGLFLDPTRIKQPIEELIEQCNHEERGSSKPVENARHLYRILVRLALARGLPDILRKYAEKEDYFFQNKTYGVFIDKTDKAIEIARKFYAMTSPS